MTKKVWFELAIYNKLTNEWELVVRVKSQGLANYSYYMLVGLYGEKNVRCINW